MSADAPAAVDIFDTTLRDGAQFEGISLSVEDKLRVAEQLDWLGVRWIEGGYPQANPRDAEFFRRVHLDLAGRIPSITEVRDVLDDDRPDKRRLWVDRLRTGSPPPDPGRWGSLCRHRSRSRCRQDGNSGADREVQAPPSR